MPTAPTRILVADEQPLVIWALERTLVAPGIEMVSAGSRDEVWDRLAGERFDVIVMSCELAESDMSDVIVEIDRLQPDVRQVAAFAAARSAGIMVVSIGDRPALLQARRC